MKKYLYLPGCALAAIALLHAGWIAHWTRNDIALAAMGAAVLLVAVGLNWTEVCEWFADPRGVFAVNTGISTIVLVAILVLVNFIARSHSAAADLTSSGRNTLTAGTREFLSKLTRDVRLRQFGQGHGNPRLDQLLASFSDGSTHVRIDFVDVARNPKEAIAYGITKPNGTIIVSVDQPGAKQDERADVRFRKVEQVNEPSLVTAMVQVLSSRRPIVCFSAGHGERGLFDTSAAGLSRLADLLKTSNFTLQPVSLLEDDPAPCAAVIVAGLQQELQPTETSRLDTYLRTGGRVAVMLDPSAPSSAVNWLRTWGIVAEAGIVLDSSGASQSVGGGPDSVLIAAYGGHEITDGFEVRTMFGRACPLETGPSANGGRAKMLAQTGQRSFVRTSAEVGNAEFDSQKDRRGPVTVAAATEAGVPASTPIKDRRSDHPRLVVFGDSDFISNGYLYVWGNRDLFLRTARWLVGENEATVVNVDERQNRRVNLTQATKNTMFAVNMIVLPLIPLIAGIVVMIRSKR